MHDNWSPTEASGEQCSWPTEVLKDPVFLFHFIRVIG